ncbi:neutral/alkaline non-lysosomal ceramidase N-terminal domain-containing protein [Anatilimnocola floriformis]|uniref:neutral/alkaline non-lysosomal ceramidase N-terminal domain-containing protein n=1 Tax=Anatilimnocola floriformis TaxID=2948575 RepID=UPI0020C1F926|nr:neutral/alkaline non-lysosomal ceramidase N-terminal domain-containing protein [Anatilimnocola floriformis]
MKYVIACLLFVIALPLAAAEQLRVGFAAAEITPELKENKPVWLAGYSAGRRATGVHDPLFVRVAVIDDGARRVAMASVDLIGLQYETVQRIRARLPKLHYVLVGSTHNHEGPDVIGMWGRSLIHRGVDDAYLDLIVDRTVQAIEQAQERLAPTTAAYGTADDDSLVGDSRLPIVKDSVLRLLAFRNGEKMAGLIVQYNSHPESMGSENTLVTADFCAATVAKLSKDHNCPVVYLSGAVGGLLAPPEGVIKDDAGKELLEGDFAYCTKYGEAVADLATKAVKAAEPCRLTPLSVSSVQPLLPVENQLYRAGRALGVLRRKAFAWTGDPYKVGEALEKSPADAQMAIQTEVAVLRLGEIPVACIPGELYPELVYGKFPAAAEAGVDYPDAPLEPHLTSIIAEKRWLLIGLANDEVGYIIPRRQWDSVAPYAYGRATSQYGEINSCGPGVAPVIMAALKKAFDQRP